MFHIKFMATEQYNKTPHSLPHRWEQRLFENNPQIELGAESKVTSHPRTPINVRHGPTYFCLF